MSSDIGGRRFGGIARLYGEEGLRRFAAAHVAVVGVGGVGSWAVEALARSGIGELTLIDMDHVAESNINRQLQALEENLGKAKVRALAERVAGINPVCRVRCVEDFVSAENLAELITPAFDYVLDCIDGFRAKAAFIAHCRRQRIRVISAGGAGGQSDPLQIRLADLSRTEQDPLLAKTRKLLRQDYGFPRNPKRRFEVPCVYSLEQQRHPQACDTDDHGRTGGLNCGGFGSAMPVTASFGLVAVSHVLKKLAAG